MLLQAILVSRDVGSTALISSAFRGAVVDIRIIRDIDEVLRTISVSKFDAIIVDYETIPEATQILSALRKSRSNQRSIAFAVIEPRPGIKDIFKDGANFILEKPLNAERVAAALRVAHGLMVSERRRYLRHEVDCSCWMKSEKGEFNLQMLNVSEGGIGVEMAVLTGERMEGAIRFRFTLPDGDAPIDGKGQLMWTKDGRAGFQFTALTTCSREELQRWLHRHFDLAAAHAINRGVSPAAIH